MAKKKRKRFAEIGTFANVVQPNDRYPMEDYPFKGQWNRAFFRNDNPIVLEMGCGKGEYTLALAEKYPETNFIGIDIKGERIWKGASLALQQGIANAGFLRIQAERINHFFGENEISGIWITFPDPQPRKPRARKRLVSPHFLERYARILKPGSPIHLKTDNSMLFDYTLEIVKAMGHTLHYQTTDLYSAGSLDETLIHDIQTHYEKIFMAEGIPIKYLRFSLRNNPSHD